MEGASAAIIISTPLKDINRQTMLCNVTLIGSEFKNNGKMQECSAMRNRKASSTEQLASISHGHMATFTN